MNKLKTKEKCKNCMVIKLGAVCPDSCETFQDLKSDFEYDMMREEREIETEVT